MTWQGKGEIYGESHFYMKKASLRESKTLAASFI